MSCVSLTGLSSSDRRKRYYDAHRRFVSKFWRNLKKALLPDEPQESISLADLDKKRRQMDALDEQRRQSEIKEDLTPREEREIEEREEARRHPLCPPTILRSMGDQGDTRRFCPRCHNYFEGAGVLVEGEVVCDKCARMGRL